MKKMAVIIVYFGELPEYMHFFIKSASYSTEADFLIFTDDDFSNYSLYENVLFKKFSLTDFNQILNDKISIGFDIKINNGYKLCDLKSLYGYLFQDYITSYLAWAHCDIDIILGDFMPIFSDLFTGNYDIISTHPAYISGAFTAYKNEERVNTLFMQSKDLSKVLLSNRYLAFDEASDVIAKLWDGHDLFDFESEIESMTHLAKQELKYGIRTLFVDAIVERVVGRINFEKGRVYDMQKEVSVFHFLVYKSNISFNVPLFKNEDKWQFTVHGFFTNTLRAYTISYADSIVTNFLTKATRKVKSIANKITV
jgi:hypothetical protein